MASVSIVIPAWNEEERLPQTLQKIAVYLQFRGHDAEIIVVDDGSVDGTVSAAKRAFPGPLTILKNGRNCGKGFSVRRGMLTATRDWVLFTDADLSTPIEEFDAFLAHSDADIMIGSRAVKGAQILTRQPFYREWGGKLVNVVVRLVTGLPIKDTQCGFKLFRRKAAQKIFPRVTIPGFGFDIEALFLARKFGFRMKELPVRWTDDPRTKVHALRDGLRVLLDLVKIRWNEMRGIY